ncbi:MAG: radical SAM protein [Candidatus Riflebacteria bacterium]|nr:radical SAM protein [Candidatus Riflebacteria bacterium]
MLEATPLTRSVARFWHATRALYGFLRAREVLGLPPMYLWLEPTNACNRHCEGCPTGAGQGRAQGYVTLDLVASVVEQAREYGAMIYFHLIGEPMLHPDLPRMIRMAHDAGLPTALFTHATLLDRSRGKALIDSGLDWLGFSFDGFERVTYEGIRKGDRYEAVLSNILGFLELRRELGARGPYCYLTTVDPTASKLADLGSDWRLLETRLQKAGLDRLERVAPHAWADALAADTRPTPARPSRCPAPWAGLAMLWNGTVVPCCLDLEGEMPVGDLKTQTIREVWNGQPLRQLRQAFAAGRWEDLPAPCRLCHVPRTRAICGVPIDTWAASEGLQPTG